MHPLPVVRDLQMSLERDSFLRRLLRELSGTLSDVIGDEEASGFISIVGRRLGDAIDAAYRSALGVERLDPEEVASVLVDLKRRILGGFYVIEVSDDRIVVSNRTCPFGGMVDGRPSLCMMTSNVFGTITAQNLGYGKVVLEKTIARGDSECRVVIHLRPTGEAGRVPGRECFSVPRESRPLRNGG